MQIIRIPPLTDPTFNTISAININARSPIPDTTVVERFSLYGCNLPDDTPLGTFSAGDLALALDLGDCVELPVVAGTCRHLQRWRK
jgi:hypothetical protein